MDIRRSLDIQWPLTYAVTEENPYVWVNKRVFMYCRVDTVDTMEMDSIQYNTSTSVPLQLDTSM